MPELLFVRLDLTVRSSLDLSCVSRHPPVTFEHSRMRLSLKMRHIRCSASSASSLRVYKGEERLLAADLLSSVCGRKGRLTGAVRRDLWVPNHPARTWCSEGMPAQEGRANGRIRTLHILRKDAVEGMCISMSSDRCKGSIGFIRPFEATNSCFKAVSEVHTPASLSKNLSSRRNSFFPAVLLFCNFGCRAS